MNNIVKYIIKNIIIALGSGVAYGTIDYIMEGTVDWETVIISTITLFIVWSIMGIIAPKLRVILGFEKKKDM